MEQKLFTVPEAAKILKLSERTVWKLIKEEKLKVVRLSKKIVRVSIPAMDEMITASEVSQSTTPSVSLE